MIRCSAKDQSYIVNIDVYHKLIKESVRKFPCIEHNQSEELGLTIRPTSTELKSYHVVPLKVGDCSRKEISVLKLTYHMHT